MALVIALASAATFVPAAVEAHPDPAGCTGTPPAVSFSARTIEQFEKPVRPDDPIILGARIDNSGQAACSLSDITVRAQVPDANGNPGAIIEVASGIGLARGVAVEGFDEVPRFDLKLNEGVSDAPISLFWSATTHSGTPDEVIDGSGATTRLKVTDPQATLSVTPDRVSGSSPLTVNYSYSLTNTSPSSAATTAPSLVPSATTGQTNMIVDENCAPVSFLGDGPSLLADPVLGPGFSWQFGCTRTFDIPGTYMSQALLTATSDADGRPWPQPRVDTIAVTVLGADLVLKKSHRDDLLAGDYGEYTLSVTNEGNRPTSGKVTVADHLPAGLTATTISGHAWKCDLSSLTCERSDPLASGATYPDVTIGVIAADSPPESVINTATVSGGGEPAGATVNNSASDPTRIRTPSHPAPSMPNEFRIWKVVARANGSVKLKVSVPNAGRVTVDDAGRSNLVRKAQKKTKRARTLSIVAKANKKLRRQLKRRGKPRKVRLKVTFKPKRGHAARITRTVKFRLG